MGKFVAFIIALAPVLAHAITSGAAVNKQNLVRSALRREAIDLSGAFGTGSGVRGDSLMQKRSTTATRVSALQRDADDDATTEIDDYSTEEDSSSNAAITKKADTIQDEAGTGKAPPLALGPIPESQQPFFAALFFVLAGVGGFVLFYLIQERLVAKDEKLAKQNKKMMKMHAATLKQRLMGQEATPSVPSGALDEAIEKFGPPNTAGQTSGSGPYSLGQSRSSNAGIDAVQAQTNIINVGPAAGHGLSAAGLGFRGVGDHSHAQMAPIPAFLAPGALTGSIEERKSQLTIVSTPSGLVVVDTAKMWGLGNVPTIDDTNDSRQLPPTALSNRKGESKEKAFDPDDAPELVGVHVSEEHVPYCASGLANSSAPRLLVADVDNAPELVDPDDAPELVGLGTNQGQDKNTSDVTDSVSHKALQNIVSGQHGDTTAETEDAQILAERFLRGLGIDVPKDTVDKDVPAEVLDSHGSADVEPAPSQQQLDVALELRCREVYGMPGAGSWRFTTDSPRIEGKATLLSEALLPKPDSEANCSSVPEDLGPAIATPRVEDEVTLMPSVQEEEVKTVEVPAGGAASSAHEGQDSSDSQAVVDEPKSDIKQMQAPDHQLLGINEIVGHEAAPVPKSIAVAKGVGKGGKGKNSGKGILGAKGLGKGTKGKIGAKGFSSQSNAPSGPFPWLLASLKDEMLFALGVEEESSDEESGKGVGKGFGKTGGGKMGAVGKSAGEGLLPSSKEYVPTIEAKPEDDVPTIDVLSEEDIPPIDVKCEEDTEPTKLETLSQSSECSQANERDTMIEDLLTMLKAAKRIQASWRAWKAVNAD